MGVVLNVSVVTLLAVNVHHQYFGIFPFFFFLSLLLKTCSKSSIVETVKSQLELVIM